MMANKVVSAQFRPAHNTPQPPPIDHGGGPPHDGDMDARLTALETKLETILPTLATKADMAELRADMHDMNASIKSWTLATMLTIIGTMLAAIFGVAQIFKTASAPLPPQQTSAPIIIQVPVQPAPQIPPAK